MADTVWDRIERARARHDVLQHPFYARWSAGELSAAELARYSGQYRHAVTAIADLSDAAAAALPERPELAEHAAEERDHIALWDGFVGAVGGDGDAAPTGETADCVEVWTERDGALAALARLYAIESGQPEISRIKREGLSDFYGINGGPGSEYFRIHEHADVAHADESRTLIAEAMEDGDEDAIVEAATAAFRANWRLLDGVS